MRHRPRVPLLTDLQFARVVAAWNDFLLEEPTVE
jgi:hypothetical protein